MIAHREYRWTLREERSPNGIRSDVSVASAKRLTDELSISPTLADILVGRGIDSYDKARTFFRPTLEDLHDPNLMEGMQRAVDRVVRALVSGERTTVYGDYDVDGTNGTALLWTFLRSVDGNVTYYIPDRVKDGYGVSKAGIDKAIADGTTLMLTVDCGITAHDQVEYARQHGVEVIVCDHHETGESVPNAHAVLDPLQPSCRYPFKHLCGCGVGLKLVQALLAREEVHARLKEAPEKLLNRLLQHVTLATTADIVSLSGENRALVKLGLEQINTNPIPGIRALIETSGLKPGRINTGQIVFVLAPRINAVGRLGAALRAVELLTSESHERAMKYAQVLEQENLTRRRIDEETFLQAQEAVDASFDPALDRAIVLHRESWHPGVIGIVASRLVERYYRPSVMLTTVDSVAKGSARSISGFNIYEALKQCERTLIQFGGHKYAAGLTVEVSRIPEFEAAFKEVASRSLTEDLLTPKIHIDAEVGLSDITPKFVRVLSQFAPFGPDNMRPVFATHDTEVVGTPRIVGRNHLKFKVRKNGHVVDAIGFNLGEMIDRVQPGRTGLHLAFSLDEGEYAGEVVPQLKIRDMKVGM